MSYDLFNIIGDLCKLEDSTLEKEYVYYLEISCSSSSLSTPIVKDTHVDDLESNSEYIPKEILVDVSLWDTFPYFLFVNDIPLSSVESMTLCDSGSLRENGYCIDPCSWIIIPFDNADNLESGGFHIPYMVLG